MSGEESHLCVVVHQYQLVLLEALLLHLFMELGTSELGEIRMSLLPHHYSEW
mgnify:CR=1 FL=1